MVLNINGERYHAEFQTVNAEAMPVRMFEYGFMIAIQEIKSYITHIKDGIKLNYPKQYVIFVEEDDNIPERELTMKVTLWDGDEKEYKVPLMRYWTETVDSLGAKHLEPLFPLQVFKLRRSLAAIARSSKPEAEKEKLTEAKLRDMIQIYTEVTEKIRDLTEKEGRLTVYNAKQMLEALQHLSEYLYSKYKGYTEIEREAIQVSKSAWGFDELITQGEQIGLQKGEQIGLQNGLQKGLQKGELKRSKETAHDMFIDGKSIMEIRKYSKLPDKDLAEVLRELPKEVQTKYNLIDN
jgi:hypothetical protein